MTTDHTELRAQLADAQTLGSGRINVACLDLSELLAAYDALAHKSAPEGKYSAEFEEAWSEYPKKGNHSKAAAYKQWLTRLKQGDSIQAMVEGMRRFAAVMVAEQRPSKMVMHAATFFGPDRHYESEWIVPREDTPRRAITDRREVIKESDEDRSARRQLWGIPDLPPSSTEVGGYDAAK